MRADRCQQTDHGILVGVGGLIFPPGWEIVVASREATTLVC